MAITVRFACGHAISVAETLKETPQCPCGERQIVRTLARPPRFVGTCAGPYAETRALEAQPIKLTPDHVARPD